ncbi:MAG: geranylgeranyl reductase family protein [Sulfuricaulis sp.]
MTRTVDLLVVGLGPAGAAAAWRGAAAGLDVLAVEKKHKIGVPVQCAEFIPGPLAPYAQDDGVLFQRINGMNTFLPSGIVAPSVLPGLMIDRAAFDRSLAARASNASAEIATDSFLIDLNARSRTAQIRRHGQTQDIAYRVLVAADGPYSAVARLLGLPAQKVIYTRQYTVPLTRPHADTDIWLSDDYPGGYAWLFPKNDLANLGLGTERRFESDLKTPLTRLHAQLVQQGRVGEEILHRTGGAIPIGGMRAALVHGTTLFAGDAAGLTHPITGAGIAAAVHSGDCAGTAAAEYLGGKAQALAAYEEDLRDQYGPAIKRAIERRAQLESCWRFERAYDDRAQRRGWIAFHEYFA